MPIDVRTIRRYQRSDEIVSKHLLPHTERLARAVDDGSRTTMTVPFDAGDLTIVYRAGALVTLARDLSVTVRTPAAVYAALLSYLITSWDLLDEEGVPWPLDRYALERLGKPTLMCIWGLIHQADTGSESGAAA